MIYQRIPSVEHKNNNKNDCFNGTWFIAEEA